MPNSIDFYRGIFLHVIPVRILVPWFVVAASNPFIIVQIYININRNAKRSQLAIALSFERKQGESSNQRSNKRQREEIEDPNPVVIVSQASTAIITEETVNTNPNLLSTIIIFNSNLSPQHRCTCYRPHRKLCTAAPCYRTQLIKGEISKIYFA